MNDCCFAATMWPGGWTRHIAAMIGPGPPTSARSVRQPLGCPPLPFCRRRVGRSGKRPHAPAIRLHQARSTPGPQPSAARAGYRSPAPRLTPAATSAADPGIPAAKRVSSPNHLPERHARTEKRGPRGHEAGSDLPGDERPLPIQPRSLGGSAWPARPRTCGFRPGCSRSAPGRCGVRGHQQRYRSSGCPLNQPGHAALCPNMRELHGDNELYCQRHSRVAQCSQSSERAPVGTVTPSRVDH